MMWSSLGPAILLLLVPSVAAEDSQRLDPFPAGPPLRNDMPETAQNESLVRRDAKLELDQLFGRDLSKRNNCPYGCSICCQDGTCVSSMDDVCCGGYYCYSGNTCSNVGGCCAPGTKPCHDGCIPEGGECCRTRGYCDPGSYCYLVNGVPKCCPAGGCLGSGGGGGVDYTTDYYTTSTDYYTTSTDYYTTTYATYWEYYSWTVTWTYWVTFYTYYTPSSTNLLTSTTTITTTVVSVRATDSAEAYSSFEDMSATLTYSVPATATDPPAPTQTSESGSGSDGGTSNDNGGGFSSGGGSLSGGASGGASGAGSLQPLFVASWYDMMMICGLMLPAILAVYL